MIKFYINYWFHNNIYIHVFKSVQTMSVFSPGAGNRLYTVIPPGEIGVKPEGAVSKVEIL